MCWKCGNSVENVRDLHRTAVCPFCGADLHCCKNCSFYEPGSHYDCHETIDEPVTDKESANFCSYFSLRTSFSGAADSAAAQQKARDAFNHLFS
ncbi:MAG: hypothetical protein LKF96_10285 [Treponema sp.]|jgi:hypothetical protein|nr:hypothetical protein [Treponema sp.]